MTFSLRDLGDTASKRAFGDRGLTLFKRVAIDFLRSVASLASQIELSSNSLNIASVIALLSATANNGDDEGIGVSCCNPATCNKCCLMNNCISYKPAIGSRNVPI